MLQVVQAYDRATITEIETDDDAALERKLQAARAVFKDRDNWLKPHQRIAILRSRSTRACFSFEHRQRGAAPVFQIS